MLSGRDVGYEHDGREVFSHVNFSVNPGDRVGLVGPNGVGKTTLLRLMAGEIEPTAGDISKDPTIETGVMPQNMQPWLDHTVRDFVAEATGVQEAQQSFDAACQELAGSGEPNPATLLAYEKALSRYDRLEVAGFDRRLERSLGRASIGSVDVDSRLGEMSGGQRTRVALAAILADKHDILLLDEPTNNLDRAGLATLEAYMQHTDAGFVVVSHDRRFLRRATNRIMELLGGDQGAKQYSLGYDEYVESREREREARLRQYEDSRRERREVTARISSLKHAANAADGNSARADNDKLTANFRSERAAGSLARRAGALATRLEQAQEVRKPDDPIELDFSFSEAERVAASRGLLSVNDLIIEYPGSDGGKVIGPIDISIDGSERVALSGANGAGKSSVIRALLGESEFVRQGDVRQSSVARIAYIDQEQTLPLATGSAAENLQALAPELLLYEVRSLLASFNFTAEAAVGTPASNLSGGERAKVLLAAVVANRANLLVLDEPTNNLDIPTVEALEKALVSYQGAMLVVSHDREFLDNLNIEREISL